MLLWWFGLKFNSSDWLEKDMTGKTGTPATAAVAAHRPNWHEDMAPKVSGACLHVAVQVWYFNSEKNPTFSVYSDCSSIRF